MSHILDSIRFRLKMASHGIFFLKSKDLKPSSFLLRTRRVRFSFPENEEEPQRYEFGKIYFEDCYRLSEINFPVRTVLDIGANIGFFSLAARKHFPAATIHAYQPNPTIQPHLRQHCQNLEVNCFDEAVGMRNAKVTLSFNEGSMHTRTSETGGDIAQISFRDAVQRLGGSVDVLKLDCEGAEWDLFQDLETWKSVKQLTMEYHLWAKPDATIDLLMRVIADIGFQILSIEPSPNGN